MSAKNNKMPQGRHKAGFRGPGPEVGKDTQFKPGESGNPAGSSKARKLSAAYAAILETLMPGDPQRRTYAELIALGVAREAIKGKIQAAVEMADRTEGRAVQAFHITGDLNLTVQEIDERLDKLLAEAEKREADARRKD
jgi:hypothetical protein